MPMAVSREERCYTHTPPPATARSRFLTAKNSSFSKQMVSTEPHLIPHAQSQLTPRADGSGWMKIKPTNSATSGLVPASYAELTSKTDVSAAASASTTSLSGSAHSASGPAGRKQGPAVAPRRGAKKVRHVEALYTYDPSGDGETAMQEGERMVLVSPDQGDGWCEVESKAGKGVVPAGWVKEA